MKKKILLTLIALLSILYAYAYDFQSGDLYYEITSWKEPYTAAVTYQVGGWSNYRGLTSVTIPATVTDNGKTYSVTTIGSSAFEGCFGLTSITIPESVTFIASSAFSKCFGLTSITIPESVTFIAEDAFTACTSLTSITIPNSVTSIGSSFVGCTSLTSVMWNAQKCGGWSGYSNSPFYSIKDSITSFTFGNEVEIISSYLCYGMSKLTDITIPNSVTSIEDYAFYECKGLTNIRVEAQTPPQCAITSFCYVPEDIPLYVPCGTKELYQAANGWSSFTNIIEEHDYTVVVQSSNEDYGTATIISYTCDNELTIQATAKEGYEFKQWSNGVTDNPYRFTVVSDLTLKAEFIPATAINDIQADTDATTPQKVLINGQVRIFRNGKTYTTTGLEVE